jgi:hypothetical protein
VSYKSDVSLLVVILSSGGWLNDGWVLGEIQKKKEEEGW